MRYLVTAVIACALALTWLVVERFAQVAQIAAMTAQIGTLASEAVALRAAVARASNELARERAATKSRLARAKLKQKAIARMQRVAVAIPIVGAAVAVYFEERDFADWRTDHPELSGTRAELRSAYAKEVFEATKEALDNEYSSLKEKFPGLTEKVMGAIRPTAPG